MTERELAEMLRNNPDLVVVDGTTLHVEDNGARNTLPSVRPVAKLTEHDLQSAVIAECDRRSILRVEYSLIFAIPNGGHRHPAVAAKLKAEGVRAGAPDLMLPVARRGYHGFFIELKCGSNKPSEAQQDWLRNLRAEGYLCHVVWDSVDEAMQLIESYLEGE